MTPNEWEHGKIAWHIPGQLGAGATIRFRFLATWYRERGIPAGPNVAVYQEPRRDAPVAGTAGEQDVILVSARLEGSDFIACSVRKQGSRARVDGFVLAAAFKPSSEVDATELERRLQNTVYFGGEEGARK